MNNLIYLDFHLFEGEGGVPGTASTAGSEQDTADVKKIQYGKSEGEGQAISQVGTDNGSQEDERLAKWNAITGKGGEFHDLYGQGISSAIQERFKNQRDLQGQVDQISNDLSPLFMNYGLQAGDFEGLKNAIEHDESFYRAGAEKAGLDVNQYKENLKLKADAERGRQIAEAYEQQQKQNELFGQWEEDAAVLQQAFPNFDLLMEIETNEKFATLLNNGVDLQTAFQVAHFDELNQGMNAYHQRTATQNVVDTIQRRASRPMEGALNHAPAVQRKTDPSLLSNEDIDEINRRVAKGEKISF